MARQIESPSTAVQPTLLILEAASLRGTAFTRCPRRDLERVLSLHYERTVNRDNTVTVQDGPLRVGRVSGRYRAAALLDDWTASWHSRADVNTLSMAGSARSLASSGS